MQIKANSGIYLLEMLITKNTVFPTDRFSTENLPEGFYYYSGSAQKGLKSRLTRHLKSEKKVHWHIDHLTTGTEAIKKIWVFENAPKQLECEIVQYLESVLKLKHPIKNFGNGDCVNECTSHLLYSPKPIDQSHLFSLYQSIVCLIPSSNDIV